VIGHRCRKAGCGSVIVLDGNMKNNRSVCLATHAGYAKYDGLPGAIQTGCPNTPAHKSRFCCLHTPNVAESDDANASSTCTFIVGKRTTRQGVNYEVCAYNLLIIHEKIGKLEV